MIRATPETLAAQLRGFRELIGISQAELARRARTSQAAVARLEAGAHAPQLRLLRRVATALGTSVTITIDP